MAQISAADPIVILSYARTPMGAMQGSLSEVSATAPASLVRNSNAPIWAASSPQGLARPLPVRL